MDGVAVRLLALSTLVATLAACDLDGGAGSAAGTVERALPPPPERPPIESRLLPNDIYAAVCRIGAPVLVKGWRADPDTRFLYFQGPFSTGHDYLSLAIPGPERRWVSGRRWLDGDRIDVDPQLASDLDRFQLTRIENIQPNIHLVRQDLGDPVLVRDVGAGRQRYIFDQKMCLGDQLLEGMYLDVERELVVKARGIEHPNELKWILSDGRPPAPDSEPVFYLDVPPEVGSPQSVALAFVRRRESQDPEAAMALAWRDKLLPKDPNRMFLPSRPGARIDDETLTYQTIRYGHDLTRITVRYEVFEDRESTLAVADEMVLSKRDDRWLVVDSLR